MRGAHRRMSKNHAKGDYGINIQVHKENAEIENSEISIFLNLFLSGGDANFNYEVSMEGLLTVKKLSVALKLTEQTIQRYVLRKEIPFHKIMIRFKWSFL